jgi:hypothetical protein
MIDDDPNGAFVYIRLCSYVFGRRTTDDGRIDL